MTDEKHPHLDEPKLILVTPKCCLGEDEQHEGKKKNSQLFNLLIINADSHLMTLANPRPLTS